MSEALWTLIGFIVGGGVNLAKDVLVDDRRSGRERRRAREDELRAARVAALLIADELDTHAMNYRQLADLGRTPVRPVAQTPNFLSTRNWDEHRQDLARLTILPMDVWTGLTHAAHNAVQLRARVEIDGTNAAFPASRIPTLRDHADAAAELASILFDAAQKIAEVVTGEPRRRRLPSLRKPRVGELEAPASADVDADDELDRDEAR